MTEKNDYDGTIYTYCHKCNEIIDKSRYYQIAHVAETMHLKICPDSTITTGNKEYFASNFPDIELEPNKVLLTIEGGVAELVSKPLGIELEIRDFDVEGIDAEGDERCKKDDEGDWYQEMIWESTVEVK